MFFDSLHHLRSYFKNSVFLFSVCNYGNIDFAVNLAINCKSLSIPFVFFALDDKSIKAISDFSDVFDFRSLNPQFSIFPSSSYSVLSADHNDPNFFNLSWLRYEIVVNLLSVGLDAFYVDTDFFFLRSPVNYLSSLKSSSDLHVSSVFVQSNVFSLPCTGFLCFFSKDFNLVSKIYSRTFLEMNCFLRFQQMHDQGFFHEVLFGNHYVRRLLHVHLLSQDYFPTGKPFYSNPHYYFQRSYAIHFNCLVKKSSKRDVMKKYHSWLLA